MKVSRKIGGLNVESFNKGINDVKLPRFIGVFIEKSRRIPLAAILIGDCFMCRDIKGEVGDNIISTAFNKPFPIDDEDIKCTFNDDIEREDVESRYFYGDVVDYPLLGGDNEVLCILFCKVIGVLLTEVAEGVCKVGYTLLHGTEVIHINEDDLLMRQQLFYNMTTNKNETPDAK